MPLRTIACLAVVLFAVIDAVSAEITPDFLMYSDPEFRLPDPVKDLTLDFKGIWIQALERPENDMQRMAAETIALAHNRGIPDLAEAVPVLEKILIDDMSHPAARFAAARALIVLESRSSSDKLFKVSQSSGTDLRQLVEPAMAEWDVTSAKAAWISRLNAIEPRRRELILAIRGLGRVRENSALSTLLEWSRDLVRSTDIRLESASAAGQLAEFGLEQDAEYLIHEKRGPQIVNRLCAVRLLARQVSDSAKRLLIEFATDAEPSVAATALKRLNEIDPALVIPLAETAMMNAYQHVREEGASAYLRFPTPERIGPLAQLLDDPHPKIRRDVCDSLFRLAQNQDLGEPIRTEAMKVLGRDRWQGQEQAALLLGALEHAPASKRLVELLESPRTEVMIASAWGLRKVADPQSIPAILDKARRQTIALKMLPRPEVDLQVAHLFEAFRQLNATEATPLLMEYIPKASPMVARSRSAAIWTLGWFHVGVPDDALGKLLIDRVMDDKLTPGAEVDIVKQMSLVSLVRMKAASHAPTFRQNVAGRIPATTLGLAHRWAVKELTGEELPEPIPPTVSQGFWFLEPLPPQATNQP